MRDIVTSLKSFMVNGTVGTNGTLRDNSEIFGTGQTGRDSLKIFSGRDKRDSGPFENFRDGTNGTGQFKHFFGTGQTGFGTIRKFSGRDNKKVCPAGLYS